MGIAPPATLAVSSTKITVEAFVPSLNFSLPAWEMSSQSWEPGSLTNRLAQQTTYSYNIVPLPQVVSSQDWSYDIGFVSPTLQCHEADNTEQPYFDQIIQDFEVDDSIFVYSQVNDTYWRAAESDTGPTRLIYSAWSSMVLPNGAPNNWYPKCHGDFNFCEKFQDTPLLPQIWVQTSNLSIVCSSILASFNYTVASVGGTQRVTLQQDPIALGNISGFFSEAEETVQGLKVENGTSKLHTNITEITWSVYLTHFFSMAAILQGNITLLDRYFEDVDQSKTDDGLDGYFITPSEYRYELGNATTILLGSGLMACDEIHESPFKYLHSNANPITDEAVIFNNTFPVEPGMCRNGSLLRAIEDLANNVTVSMLSASALTSLESTPRTLLTSNTIRVYKYDPLYLFLSYGVGLLISLIVTITGMYSIYANKGTHLTSFSTIIAATRNPELDLLTFRSSTSDLKLESEVRKKKLRFGLLLDKKGEYTRARDDKGSICELEEAAQLAFGFEGTVSKLEKPECLHAIWRALLDFVRDDYLWL